MAIHRCKSFSLDLLKGRHDFENDTFRLALYSPAASFDSDTTAYTATNEIVATGYTAGGTALTLTTGYPKLEDQFGSVRFEDATWAISTPTTIGWALLYNATESNLAVCSIEINSVEIAGAVTVRFPISLPPIVQVRFPVT